MIEEPTPPIGTLTSADLARFAAPALPDATTTDDGTLNELWERDVVPDGERDNALMALAGFARQHPLWRLSREGLRALVSGARQAVEQPPRREITDADVARLASSAARYAVGEPSFEVAVPSSPWLQSTDFPSGNVPAVLTWHLHGFVPRGGLVTMFGEGGIGKTTWAAWLVARATQRGANTGIISCEEVPDRFYAQVRESGGDTTRLLRPERPLSFRLPQSADDIEEAITNYHLDLLYFDSLYDHFAHADSENAAERARRALSPLSDIAQRTGCTILGNFHTNKAGEYLGSTEVRNVSRVMLKVAQASPTSPLTIAVVKTNYRLPGYRLAYRLSSIPFCTDDGTAYLEEGADGVVSPATIGVVTPTDDLPVEATTTDLAAPRSSPAEEWV